MEIFGLAATGATEAFEAFNQTVLPLLGGNDAPPPKKEEDIQPMIKEDIEPFILDAILRQARGGEVPFNQTAVWFCGSVYGGFEPREVHNTHLLAECFILGPYRTVEELNKDRKITENK